MTQTWESVCLEQVLKRVERFEAREDTVDYRFAGTYSYARGIFSSGIKREATFKLDKIQRIHSEDFVYCKIMAWEGAFGLVPESLHKYVMSGAFVAYDIDRSRLEPLFLDWYFKISSIWQGIGSQSSGTNVRRQSLHPSQFEASIIPLPPLEEQKRIVAIVENLAAQIAEARGLREKANLSLHQLREIDFDALVQKDWTIETIENLVGKINLKNGKSLKWDGRESSISCLTLTSVRNGKINHLEAKPVSISSEIASPYIIKKDDVFIVRGNGSKHLVGRAGIVENTSGDVIYPDLFIKVPLENTRVLPDFFVAAWNSQFVREQIEKIAKTTSEIWKINQNHIASIQIPVPEIAAQKALITELMNVRLKSQSLLQLQEATRLELNALLPSVLSKAFAGEL